jgi:hypothetical protein
MRLFSSLRVIAALLGAGVCLPFTTLAQPQDATAQQSASVADAARRARDQKKSAAKSSKVITEEDLDQHESKPGQGGFNVMAPAQLETQPPSAEAVAADQAADKASEEEAKKEAATQDADIAKLKLQITQGEKDLDVLQRQLVLDQDSYFSKPDYANDTAGKSTLDNEKQQINGRREEVERLKTRLAALEELKSHHRSARTKAAPPAQTENSPATPPAQP